MRVVLKTIDKVVFEVGGVEFDREGFDTIWDKIRNFYTVDKYEIHSIEEDREIDNNYFIELRGKKRNLLN